MFCTPPPRILANKYTSFKVYLLSLYMQLSLAQCTCTSLLYVCRTATFINLFLTYFFSKAQIGAVVTTYLYLQDYRTGYFCLKDYEKNVAKMYSCNTSHNHTESCCDTETERMCTRNPALIIINCNQFWVHINVFLYLKNYGVYYYTPTILLTILQ